MEAWLLTKYCCCSYTLPMSVSELHMFRHQQELPVRVYCSSTMSTTICCIQNQNAVLGSLNHVTTEVSQEQTP